MVGIPSALAEAIKERYVLVRELGRGGMATVYLARDLRHDRPVALKVLHPELAQALGSERFQREIKLAARLQHPNILSVHDSGEAAGHFWFTMPYVEGESLRETLRRERQLSVDDALRIVREAADALDCAHRHSIIHRDIKPENILVSEGHALVADFGISRALESFLPAERLTEAGLVLGTPTYMSPEQAMDEPGLDGRTDVYSLGVVLYELLAGEPPHTGPTAQAVLAKRLSEPVPPIRRARTAVPEAVEQVLQRALAPIPADRFRTAAEFARALDVSSDTTKVPGTSSRPVGIRPSAVTQSRPRVPLAVVLGLGFLLGLGVLFGWLRSHDTPEIRGARSRRLAVLPFESVGDTAERAFAAGISEEITTRLARVPGLSLVARSSALQYPRSGQTAPQFGRSLKVDYVLDGTVRSAVGAGGQKQLRITPELIRVTDGTRLWGEPYEGQLKDVFRLQGDVAERVAEALRGRLGGGEQRDVRVAPTSDLEAFRLYTLGRAEWNRRTDKSLERAADYFSQAIARDSAFARAWAGLADSYALFDYYGVRNMRRDTAAYSWAKSAALRAIALDSTLAEPHASLNQILRYGYWDWTGSEREIRRAIALDPNYATAHKWLAEHLITLGHLPDAIAEAKRAVQLDPLAPAVQVTLAVAHWYAGQVDEAIAVLRSALERDSGPSQLQIQLFDIYRLAGRSNDAIALLDARRDTSTYLRALARARTDPSARALVLREVHSDSLATHVDIARTYAYLGERERALTELERAAAERDPRLEMIKVERHYASLREDPRFGRIVARMGLPP